ncbi:bifunctional glycosyltransferase family 2 protein/CDP-glycerol:glycerophosphate glycerophosphotransferase [Actinospica sp. MGRD01-02]|uniref:Bifunctional glycosyltransferase family 2 protein/CDP-glycerol:glycerophosphate glycerophosphotransferase n=1 Tax=Actinospica acidithermotolerans TaxID=2828514 RepID=A0A941EAU9_9ACTN|nr:CDP-glycerol glycerophosphotransferase family protein [Actinospica acidithermotolerans]MBR7828126.1 bifunctional glycosyltransferase family 2 protein/CDP-glycerol:glycerophosphate glycerophosphotransferase [Actinospica acidithermotolerans]
MPEQNNTATPDLTVVVIGYNDAARLPEAVRSALDQTLHNLEVVVVDDHSSDDTPQVVARLAAEDPRVRFVRLESNSGGCSKPRNTGIEHARGRYVMFLDSDDVLDRHAGLNMLQAAEEYDADLVSGLCIRRHVNRSGLVEDVPWWPEMYTERRVLESAADDPDLLRDTLSTNKCYRLDFLRENAIRFPEGFHWEDLLFSATAYLHARKIVLIPNPVYYWEVMVRVAAKSISNQRSNIGNVRDRIGIHRKVDAVLDGFPDEAGRAQIRLAKAVKFIEHDLVLYLRELPYQTDEYIAECRQLFRDYLQTLPLEAAFARCRHRVAVAGAFLMLRQDWPGLVTVSENLLDRTRVSTDLVERDGRIYWCDKGYLDEDFGRLALDVTEAGYHQLSLPESNLATRLTGLDVVSVTRRNGRIRLSGETVNPLGKVPADVPLSAQLEFRPGQRALRQYRVKVAEVSHEGDRIRWSGEVDVARTVRPVGVVDQMFEVRFRLKAGDLGTMATRVTAIHLPEAAAELELPARPLLTKAVGDRWAVRINHRGVVTLQIVSRNPIAKRVNASFERNATGTGGGGMLRLVQKAMRTAQKANDPRLKRKVYAALCRLPVKKGSVVFESHMGLSYSDSPKYIYEALRHHGYQGRVTWSYAENTNGFPKDASLVARNSWAYLRALARAEFWVDNQGFPQWMAKRRHTTYIQTWHGTALKTMGVNTPQVKAMLTGQRKALAKAVNRFDHFLVRGEYDIRTLVEAFEMRAEPLRVGYPRNDLLLSPERAELSAALRARFGFAEDKTVLLYAPTFRNTSGPFKPDFSFEDFAREFGDTHLLLVRAHYLNSVSVPEQARGAVQDVSKYPDVTELFLASDALITDFSSVMFDYSLLDRPMVFFAPDKAGYTQDRGTYFDLEAEAPGPYTTDQESFFKALAALTPESHREERRAFAQRFGEYEKGTAAEQVYQRFFAKGGK